MIVYGPMGESEVNCVHDLIVRVFHEHVAPVYSKNGIEKFLSIVSPGGLSELNDGQRSFVILAKQSNRPIGMIAVRDESHVALIFVDSEYQGKGIGKHLLDEATKICQNRDSELTAITVSSSPNSIQFYKGLGFEAQGDEVDEDGMRYTPMQKIIN